MNEIIDRLGKTLDTLQTQVVHYAPQAWAIALQIKRLQGIQNLVSGLLWLIVFGFLLWLTIWGIKKVRESNTWEASLLLAFPIIGMVMAFFAITDSLFDIWNWVAVFAPGLGIAHDLTVKFLGQ